MARPIPATIRGGDPNLTGTAYLVSASSSAKTSDAALALAVHPM